jgi:hypothetical protein
MSSGNGGNGRKVSKEVCEAVREYVQDNFPAHWVIVSPLQLLSSIHKRVSTVSQKSQFHGNYILVTTSDVTYQEHRFCKIAIVIDVPCNRLVPHKINDTHLVYKCDTFSVYRQEYVFALIDSPVCDIMIKKQGSGAGKQHTSDRTKTRGYYYLCAREDMLDYVASLDFTKIVEKRGNLVVPLSKNKVVGLITSSQ